MFHGLYRLSPWRIGGRGDPDRSSDWQLIFKVLTGGLELAAFWSLLLAMVVVSRLLV